jgi:adenine-specific DNA-methyltransferase
VLSAPEVDEHRIPWRFLRPILPGPRHLSVDEIVARDDGTPDLDERLFLLSAQQPEESLRDEHPRLWNYLLRGMELGIHQRYLCRHRRPWYSQEHRPPAPLLCTYMGRQGDTGRPFRFILNRSSATAANVYLLLYPRPQLCQAMERDEDLLPRIWAALNELPVEVLIGEGRVYGGGLHKLEPRELANTSLDALGIRFPDAVIVRENRDLDRFGS